MANRKRSRARVCGGLENRRGHGRPAATVGAREPGGSGADWSSGDATVLVMETTDVRESDDLSKVRWLDRPGLRTLLGQS